MKARTLKPEFAEFVPPTLAEGVLYVSEKYRTASHLCCCGCGTKIVTPLKPTGWSIKVRNGRVSLWPSIGNWNHPCQSHYVIRDNQILWARAMTPQQIALGRARDDARKRAYFLGGNVAPPAFPDEEIKRQPDEGLLAAIWQWVRSGLSRWWR